LIWTGLSILEAQRCFRENHTHRLVWSVSSFTAEPTAAINSAATDYQKLYDEGIQIALKYLGE
jgi:hypothetical protein